VTASPPGLRDWPAFQLYKCGWWLQQRVGGETQPLGLGGRHFMVLTMLQASSELSQQEMATFMSLDPTLMVALIDDLEAQGLCERTRNPADRRRYVVRITAKGRRLYRRARAVSDRIEADVFGPLAEDEQARLAETLTRVMEPYWAEKQEPPRRRAR
jgi:DNA-binding MarR family transcriptional regulator